MADKKFNIKDQLAGIAALIAAIVAIGGGFSKYGELTTKINALELASKKTVCEISNVLSGKSVTIDYLADQLMEVIGTKVNKIYEDLSLEDPKKSDGTVENMSKLLSTDMGQFTKFKKGLEETVQYIKNKE